ncbi:MAG: metalloregulator ArsR/SmtB family transcription factor [Gemmatimonadota bacterium]
MLYAMAEPTRLGILRQLVRGECCVCALGGELEVEQSLLSHHLRTLRKSGLVQARREGRWAYYSLNPHALITLRELLDNWISATLAAEASTYCGNRAAGAL